MIEVVFRELTNQMNYSLFLEVLRVRLKRLEILELYHSSF